MSAWADAGSWEQMGLELAPTPAMRCGVQSVWQCAFCGTVVVVPGDFERRSRGKPSGDCPMCGAATWWRQSLPLAGFAEATA